MTDKIMRASTEIAEAIPEIWSATFYPTLLEALPFNESISRDYEGEIQALGDTVNVLSVPQFDEATELLEDARNDADSVTITKQQLVINKRVVKDYIMTSLADRQGLDTSNTFRDLAMFAIMKKMQALIIAATIPSASAPDHQIAYDSGSTLALADILEAKELLDVALIPDMNRQMILDAPQWNDLFNITGFVSRDYIPTGSPYQTGTFATPILGFTPKMTTEASAVSYFLHPQYMTIAVQEQPTVKVYDLGVDGKRAYRVNVDVLFGIKQLGNTRVVEIA